MNTALRPYGPAKPPVPLAQKLMRIDWTLAILITLIACAGFMMLYSAAAGSIWPWAGRQMIRFVFAFAIFLAVACVDLRVWLGLAYPAYWISFALLVAVEVAGHVGLGAQRWIEFGPLALQPSELMKIALILALARYLHGLPPNEVSRPSKLVQPLLMVAAPVVLVLMQPNLGTATILALCGATLLFLAGLSWYWIGSAFAAIAVAVPTAWEFLLHDYQRQRVLTFLHPDQDALGAGWNITQAKIALGSGGLAGKGFLLGTQSRLNFLPESQTDFILPMVGEEFGFLGTMVLLVIFSMVIYHGIQIAMRSRSQFGRLLAMGITVNFFLYIMINGLMVMGLIPVVGIPMPLISYGGTAMMTVMFGFGLLMSVRVHRQVDVPRHAGGMI
jgi:rod shape determining protein RodA